MNLPVIAAPGGEILGVGGPLPGAVHDLTAARIGGIIRALAAAGLIVLAGPGYHGAGDPVLTPYRGRPKPAAQQQANRAHAPLRSPRRARQRPAQKPAPPAQTPLLPGDGRPRWPRPSTAVSPARPKDDDAHCQATA
jgi:hypothetical protein